MLHPAFPLSCFERHIASCNNIGSPANLIPFRIGDQQIGWLGSDLGRALAFFPRDFHFDARGVAMASRHRSVGARSQAFAGAVQSLAKRGHLILRNELFDVRATETGPILAQIDRGALPAFGIITQGVHVNGIVRRIDGLHLWLGRRSLRRPVAPGQIDNLVAGGIPAGLTPAETVIKEAAEEASIAPELSGQATPSGRVSYIMATEEGLRRDLLHCYDIELPEDLIPRPDDDEVERFELWPIAKVVEEVALRDTIKFNVNLVLIDFFLRHGILDQASPDAEVLRSGLDQMV